MTESDKKESLKRRLKEGAVLRQCNHENGTYVVHLTTDPPLVFNEKEEEQVDRILHELNQI